MDINGNDLNKSTTKSGIKAKNIKTFEWDNYLKICDGKPAPAECFNQNIDPPINEFELKQKLEVTSPDNSDFVNLATIVNFLGPRLQLRLDGCDNSNDIFELVDSEEINPIGTHITKKQYFAAPLRFRKDAASYSSFCTHTLKNAIHAPKSAFKPAPKAPSKNLFKVGTKLEAVDIKHPSNICPASVVHVERDSVEIHLDGWDQTNGFKCSFLSRNLFPVGWCKKAGHLLQHPGPKAMKNIEDAINAVCNDNDNNVKCDVNILPVNNKITNNDKTEIINDINLKSDLPVNNDTVNNKTNVSNNSVKNNTTTTTTNSVTNNVPNNIVTNTISKSNRGIKRDYELINQPQEMLLKSQTPKPATNGSKYQIIDFLTTIPSKKEVNFWTVEDVIKFLNIRIPEFSKYENQFRSHDIDGKAFLLLKNDLITKFMNITLGCSLKICNIVDKINEIEI